MAWKPCSFCRGTGPPMGAVEFVFFLPWNQSLFTLAWNIQWPPANPGRLLSLAATCAALMVWADADAAVVCARPSTLQAGEAEFEAVRSKPRYLHHNRAALLYQPLAGFISPVRAVLCWTAGRSELDAQPRAHAAAGRHARDLVVPVGRIQVRAFRKRVVVTERRGHPAHIRSGGLAPPGPRP
ncbi:hypothetical protein B0G77_0389 [Paraburkholderia sp. BL10I2N1]|nr:hypothetical protein B0G77_0389 [Paraburkholderia sp. BL10I2N1]